MNYPCPCCGYLTARYPRRNAIADICPVCFWENDVFTPGEDDPSDENHGMTLRHCPRRSPLKFRTLSVLPGKRTTPPSTSW